MRGSVGVLRALTAGIVCLMVADVAGADVTSTFKAGAHTVTVTTVCPNSIYDSATAPFGKILGLYSTPTAGGGGYTLNDVLTIAGGNGAATCKVTAVSGGVVQAVSLVAAGLGYATGTGKATTGGTGTGCTVNIISVCPPFDGAADGKIVWPAVLTPPAFSTIWNPDQDAGFTHRTYGGAVCGPGANITITSVMIGEGSMAGDLHSSLAIPDTAFASIGLYGGPAESLMTVVVDRSNPNQVGLTFSPGTALQARAAGSSHEQPISTFKVLVYEDAATADADPSHTGALAKFRGTVILNGSSGTLQTHGGFSGSDWFLVNQGAGKYVARPSPGLQKIVPVANSANAAMVVIGDPVIAQPTPGVSSAILILLSIVLAATGMVALRKRAGHSLA
jgi:hypothetical protein